MLLFCYLLSSTTGYSGRAIRLLLNKNEPRSGAESINRMGNGECGLHIYKAAAEDHGSLSIQNNLVASNQAFGIIMEGVGVLLRNTIFDNGADEKRNTGILEGSSYTHAHLTQNLIFNNGGLGIDIDTPWGGVKANDPGDTDIGANDGMNFPVLESAKATAGKLHVKGYIDTPNPKTITIEFYANLVPNMGGDPSGSGEGAIYMGGDYPNPHGKINATLPKVAPGTLITATATDAEGNTSEFSAYIVAK